MFDEWYNILTWSFHISVHSDILRWADGIFYNIWHLIWNYTFMENNSWVFVKLENITYYFQRLVIIVFHT